MDTGALYRAVAFAAKEKGVLKEDDSALAALCRNLALRFVRKEDGTRLFLDNKDITGTIRTPEITMLSSSLSARKTVRDCLFNVQREMGKEKGKIFEGRDMGTVVFPDADIKFFLDASLHIRAKRRYLEYKNQSSQTPEAVQKDMEARDSQDQSRALSPLLPAPDAIKIDTGNLDIEQVIKKMLAHVQSRV